MVRLIVRPEIDWYKFVDASKSLSPTRALDSINVPVGSLVSYLMCLGQLDHPHVSPIEFLKSDLVRSSLEHLHFSFYFETTDSVVLEILKIAPIKVISSGESGIMTGSLLNFRDVILIGMRKTERLSVRNFISQLYIEFIQMGFRDLFADYEPKRSNDTGIYLEPK